MGKFGERENEVRASRIFRSTGPVEPRPIAVQYDLEIAYVCVKGGPEQSHAEIVLLRPVKCREALSILLHPMVLAPP